MGKSDVQERNLGLREQLGPNFILYLPVSSPRELDILQGACIRVLQCLLKSRSVSACRQQLKLQERVGLQGSIVQISVPPALTRGGQFLLPLAPSPLLCVCRWVRDLVLLCLLFLSFLCGVCREFVWVSDGPGHVSRVWAGLGLVLWWHQPMLVHKNQL